MSTLELFQPRTIDGLYSSQIFTSDGSRYRVALDFRDNPTGLTSFCRTNPSTSQLCFDVPNNSLPVVRNELNKVSSLLSKLVQSSEKELKVQSVSSLLQNSNEAYPAFVKFNIPKSEFSDPSVSFAYLVDSDNNHLKFNECKDKEVVFVDAFVDSVFCKNSVLSIKLQLVQAIFSANVREQPKLVIPAHNLVDTAKKNFVVSKPTKNVSALNSVYQVSGDDKMLLVRFGANKGGLFPINYSYSPPSDGSSSKGRVKFEVYNSEELEALSAIEQKIIAAAKTCADLAISATDTVDCEGLIPENYVKGTPILMSSKVDVSDAQVCVDVNDKPVSLEKLKGCRFKYIDVYMSNVYTRKVKSFVTVGVCKKIKQIVVYPPIEPVYFQLSKRKLDAENVSNKKPCVVQAE